MYILHYTMYTVQYTVYMHLKPSHKYAIGRHNATLYNKYDVMPENSKSISQEPCNYINTMQKTTTVVALETKI